MVSSRRLSRNHDKPRNATNFDENRVSKSLQGHFSLVCGGNTSDELEYFSYLQNPQIKRQNLSCHFFSLYCQNGLKDGVF